jgi:hypothetical protein
MAYCNHHIQNSGGNAMIYLKAIAAYRFRQMAGVALGLMLVCFQLTGIPAAAAHQVQHRVPVLVVMVDKLPVPGARAVIERRVRGAPNDVILLTPETATARQLSAAVLTLLAARATAGERPSQAATVRVNMTEGPQAWIETEERRAEGIVRRLRRSNPRYVPGYGFVRATMVSLPAGALNGRLHPKS